VNWLINLDELEMCKNYSLIYKTTKLIRSFWLKPLYMVSGGSTEMENSTTDPEGEGLNAGERITYIVNVKMQNYELSCIVRTKYI